MTLDNVSNNITVLKVFSMCLVKHGIEFNATMSLV